MKFWLGTHRPNWLELVDIPLFLSRRTLADRKSLPEAKGEWALDSGGFSELSMYGEWRTETAQYIEEVHRFTEMGGLQWAAPQDWMCEPHIVEKTGLSVAEHQRRTVDNYLQLSQTGLPFVPVLQGWTVWDYESHWWMYQSSGVDLVRLPLVAVGSVCRRQQLEGGAEIIEFLASEGVKIHAFGMKANGLKTLSHLLASSDSMAWSDRARWMSMDAGGVPNLPQCVGKHKSCANCLDWALMWRLDLLKKIGQ